MGKQMSASSLVAQDKWTSQVWDGLAAKSGKIACSKQLLIAKLALLAVLAISEFSRLFPPREVSVSKSQERHPR